MVLAYHITWTTYGTWLPGDERGWVEDGTPGIRDADAARKYTARRTMTGPSVILSAEQRATVECVIRDHCAFRGWTLHALNVRTTHVHVIVTANRDPEDIMNQLKAWASRRLNAMTGEKCRWWTEHGSTKWIKDDAYLRAAINYVLNCQ